MECHLKNLLNMQVFQLVKANTIYNRDMLTVRVVYKMSRPNVQKYYIKMYN